MSKVIPFPAGGRAGRPVPAAAPSDHLELSRRALERVRVALGLPEPLDTVGDHLELSRRALERVQAALTAPDPVSNGADSPRL